jgi:hypothetical protein
MQSRSFRIKQNAPESRTQRQKSCQRVHQLVKLPACNDKICNPSSFRSKPNALESRAQRQQKPNSRTCFQPIQHKRALGTRHPPLLETPSEKPKRPACIFIAFCDTFNPPAPARRRAGCKAKGRTKQNENPRPKPNPGKNVVQHQHITYGLAVSNDKGEICRQHGKQRTSAGGWYD